MFHQLCYEPGTALTSSKITISILRSTARQLIMFIINEARNVTCSLTTERESPSSSAENQSRETSVGRLAEKVGILDNSVNPILTSPHT